ADVSAPVFAPALSNASPGRRTGYLLFIRENTLVAQPFDSGSAQTSGDVFPVAEGVALPSNIHYAPVTVSGNGMLLYKGGGRVGGSQLVWYDRSGKPFGGLGMPGSAYPAISPDEKMIAYSRLSGQGADIWLRDVARGTDIRL